MAPVTPHWSCVRCRRTFASEKTACPVCSRKPHVKTIGPSNRNQTADRRGLPGTELERIVPRFFSSAGCNCKSYARKMDRWGVGGCEERFDEIVAYLCKQASKRRIIKHFGVVNRLVASRWVIEAIDTAKRKECTPDKPISAVWVYWSGGADRDELRYSMRSIARHFTGLRNVVLCGDREPWFTGDFIPSPKWTEEDAVREYGVGTWAKWTDSIVKLQRIIDSPLVTDQFLWLYDDTFFLKDVSVSEASVHRRTGRLFGRLELEANSEWKDVRKRTAAALLNAGRPDRNYSHHGPVVYDKNLLQKTIDEFNPRSQPRVIESLYVNHHFDERQTEPLRDWMVYTKFPSRRWTPRPSASVVNVGIFTPQVRSVIDSRFPEPSPVEDMPCVSQSASR